MQTATIDAAPKDFRALAIRVREAGLLDRRPGYYSVKITLTLAFFVAGWAALVVVGNSWATLGVAAFLGLMFTQLAFVGHDAGHQQIFRSRRANWLMGLAVADGLIGLSLGWWVPKHNAHHAHPNEIDRDPDIGAGFIVIDSANGLHAKRGRLERFLARWQAWLFFPFMLLRTVGLHVSGIQRLLQRRDRPAVVEVLLMGANAVIYLSLVIWVLSPVKALAFIVVQQSIFSVYLGLSFAPNHKAMPVVEGNAPMSFAQRQVDTAHNIRGGPFTNFVYGGLNHQIEHHLFPTMPRPNLARAQRLVQAFCVENHLGYSENGVIGSYRQILRQLSAAGLLTAEAHR